MKIKNIDIKSFYEDFNKEYEFLYENNDNVAEYKEAAEAFDEFAENHREFIGEFVRYRGDFIASDRETAAFMFALERYMD